MTLFRFLGAIIGGVVGALLVAAFRPAQPVADLARRQQEIHEGIAEQRRQIDRLLREWEEAARRLDALDGGIGGDK